MKNYYDELEVSKTASKEVIEKAYRVLAKKYHPDTTQEADKYAAEEKFKVISEAYEILSDDGKREKYDLELEQSTPNISYEEYVDLINQKDSLNNALSNLENELNQYKRTNNYNQNYYQNNSYQYNESNLNYNNTSQDYTQNNNKNSKKKTYYYTDTGKPASAYAYYKFKIKQFFSNLGLILLAIIALILAINSLLNFDISFLLF